ncbi:MAG TPA: hypothetical protein ENH06_01695 [bacterium]|nr:hypothetical protein [bacterium]
MPTMISQQTKKLIQKYQHWYNSLQKKEGVSTIHVDEVAAGVASFYEKIRGLVDWREEHLLRKTAIERNLKRRLFLGKDGEKIADPLVYELIRGGHFPNDMVLESKIEEVQKALDKYILILENESLKDDGFKLQMSNWILGIAACEIEEILSPSLKENALIEYMTNLMKERIEVKENIIVFNGIKEEEKNTQIYTAVQRALFKLDSPIISYHLLKKRYKEWKNLPDLQIKEVGQNIYSIYKNIEKDLNHPLADKFYKICERYNTPYIILGDIISEDPIKAEENISDPIILESLIKKAYNQRLKTLKSRLGRAAFYATLSIFLTNVVALLAIEIPFAKYIVTGEFNSYAVIMDILGPTFLMAFLIITIVPPKKGNFEQVIMEVMKIAHEKEIKDIYMIKSSKKRGVLFKTIISIFYIITFIISYGVIIWGLYKLNFPPLSYLIFVIFLSLIAFAGAKIRERSKELQVIEDKTTFSGFFIDLFSIPVLQTGKWLSSRFIKYNIIIVLFNSLIDMPFQIFTEFLEQWRSFLKEKKEEIH